MEKPNGKRPRVEQLSKMACVACRRLKMKCVGEINQPCARCVKTGRKCVFQPNSDHKKAPVYGELGQASSHDNSRPFASAPNSKDSSPYISPHHTLWSPYTQIYQPSYGSVMFTQAGDGTQAFSTATSPEVNSAFVDPPLMTQSPLVHRSPLATLTNRPAGLAGRSRSYHDGEAPVPPMTPMTPMSPNIARRRSVSEGARERPTEDEMSQLCRFFVVNLLDHIPILGDQDLGDVSEMIRRGKRPLVCSMVYVAARFIPGCKSIQNVLLPEILAMLKMPFTPTALDAEAQWTLLQAYAVLYNWTLPQPLPRDMNSGDSDNALTHDALKTSLHRLIGQCSLHKSAEEVVSISKRNTNSIRHTLAFRKYLYWLWMFGQEHYRALILRTPPDIRDDSTIRMSAQILQNYRDDKQVHSILARVQLCLVWSQSSLQEQCLGEWWCSIPSGDDPASTLGVLKTLDDALDNWRRKWCSPQQLSKSSSVLASAKDNSIELHYCFTRLCASMYATRLSQFYGSAQSAPSASLDLTTKSVERASAFCYRFLHLNPLAKSTIRFAPEENFCTVALACEYVLAACRILSRVSTVKKSHIDTVNGVAELMIDFGVDNRHCARLYGKDILAKIDATRANQLWTTPQISSTSATSEPENGSSISYSPNHNNLYESIATLDDIWPLQCRTERHLSEDGHQLGLAVELNSGAGISNTYSGVDSFAFGPTWGT